MKFQWRIVGVCENAWFFLMVMGPFAYVVFWGLQESIMKTEEGFMEEELRS